MKSGRVLNGDKITFMEFSEIWLKEYAEKKLEQSTLSGYRIQLRHYILPEIGHYKLTQISPLQLQRFYNRLSETGKRDGRGLSRSSLKQVDAVISGIYQAAVRWGYVADNPCKSVELPSEKKTKKIEFFTPEQAQTFLSILDKPMQCPRKAHDRVDDTGKPYHVNEYTEMQQIPLQIKRFMYMAIFTGARRGKLLALTWGDIDQQKRLLSIIKSLTVIDGQVVVKRPKNDTSNRTISLQPELCQMLRQWETEQNRQRLGHSNASTTMNIYAHSLVSQDEAAADAVSEALRKA